MNRTGPVLLALGALLLAAIVASRLVVEPGRYGDLDRAELLPHMLWRLAAGAAYLSAVGLIWRRAVPNRVLLAALALGLAARLVTFVAPPIQSTDLYRYVWDGKVQTAGINPYRYIPADPALSFLRDEWHGPESIYRNINRAETAPTIYPPAAQALFALIGLSSPTVWTMKGVMLLFDLVAGACAWGLLRAARRPDAWVLVWAWNPLVIWEFAGAGHIDAAGLAALGAALLLAARARLGWAGAALGVAILVKLLPAALAPAIWRRWEWRAPLAAVVTVLAGYACYASVGWKVFGYLSGYTEEEQLDAGGGFLLLRLIGPVPGWAAKIYVAAGLLGLAVLAAWIVRRPLPPLPARAGVIARGALLLAGGMIAVLSPHYPWYLAILVLPAVACPAWSALWPSVAGPLLYMDPYRGAVVWSALVYVPAVLLLAVDVRRKLHA